MKKFSEWLKLQEAPMSYAGQPPMGIQVEPLGQRAVRGALGALGQIPSNLMYDRPDAAPKGGQPQPYYAGRISRGDLGLEFQEEIQIPGRTQMRGIAYQQQAVIMGIQKTIDRFVNDIKLQELCDIHMGFVDNRVRTKNVRGQEIYVIKTVVPYRGLPVQRKPVGLSPFSIYRRSLDFKGMR